MGSLSLWHWLIVIGVVLLLFGGRGKISDVMGDFAKGIKSFKKGLADDDAPEKPAEPARAEEAKVIEHQTVAAPEMPQPRAKAPAAAAKKSAAAKPKATAKTATKSAATKAANARKKANS